MQRTDDQKLDAIVQECERQQHRDKICDSLINLKNIGDDSIEAIKEYIELGVYQYYALTALNYALTGRLRIKFGLTRQLDGTVDIQRDYGQFSVAMPW